MGFSVAHNSVGGRIEIVTGNGNTNGKDQDYVGEPRNERLGIEIWVWRLERLGKGIWISDRNDGSMHTSNSTRTPNIPTII